MIPYIAATVWHLGPIPIQVWGLFVASGIVLGWLVSRWRAKKLGLDVGIVDDVATWIIVAAMVGGRVWHVLFYEPLFFWQNPSEIVQVWHGGMSVMGGFLAAFAVGVWRLKKRGVAIWQYADALIFGLPIGLMAGRLGCFLIHDHPGIPCPTCTLAVLYPDGVPRLDHGLLLSINGALMACLFFLLAKYQTIRQATSRADGMKLEVWRSRIWLRQTIPAHNGFFVATFAVWYGVVRFILDFFRVGDTKWLGLTSTQYACLTITVFGVLWFLRHRNGVIQSPPVKS